MLKKILKIFLVSILLIFSTLTLNINAGNDNIRKGNILKEVPGKNIQDPIKKGMKDVKKHLGNEIEKELTASQQIQKIIQYLLTFITLIATIYVIYTGFRVLTSSGDEETIKTSKKTILYIILGILLIWFAYEIAYFATSFGELSKNY